MWLLVFEICTLFCLLGTGSHFAALFIGSQEVGFSNSNYPSLLQFKSVTFSEVSRKKVLFHLGCYSGEKNKFLEAVH